MKITLDLDTLAQAGLTIRQHQADSSLWVAGLDGKGDTEPCGSPEAATLAGVAWLVRSLREAQADDHAGGLTDMLEEHRRAKERMDALWTPSKEHERSLR